MLTIQFRVSEGRTTIMNPETGKTACEIVYDGRLSVRLYFTFADDPLILSAQANTGDDAELRIRPCRLELYIQHRLCDEEWPCGRSLFGPECVASGDFEVLTEETDDAGEHPASRARTGVLTREIRLPGVNIGDCMPYSDPVNGGRYHLFYLYDRHHHDSKWGFGAHQWAHISTADFKTWDEHPMALPITEDWEGSICTGSVCRGRGEDGEPAYYAWYAVRMCDGSPARMTYAKSRDLIHFQKCGTWFCMPDGYEPASARDPKVFEADGVYHMFVTTSRLNDQTGCLAHLVNDRMATDGWKDAGTVLSWGGFSDEENASSQPECPDYFKMGDYYYLVFGIGGVSRYVYSKKPYGRWTYPGETIPCGNVPKSALLPGTGRRIFCGFVCEDGYAGGLCAAEAFQLSDGRLRFKRLEIDAD